MQELEVLSDIMVLDFCEKCISSNNIQTCRIFYGWCFSHFLPYCGYKLSNKVTIENVSKTPDDFDIPIAVDICCNYRGNKKNITGYFPFCPGKNVDETFFRDFMKNNNQKAMNHIELQVVIGMIKMKNIHIMKT